ncbi:hypothetical protein JCM16303_002855 [Sporobolomyces ruberrimus]
MAHELRVEGDKVVESDQQGHVLATKDYSRVHAGYLATTHNPRVSDEAKHNAETILHDLEAAHGDTEASSPSKAKTVSHDASAAGGHETRSHDHHELTAEEQSKHHAEEVHLHRQIGAYKAILHRDDRSEEAKKHAREELEKLGVDPKEYEQQQ